MTITERDVEQLLVGACPMPPPAAAIQQKRQICLLWTAPIYTGGWAVCCLLQNCPQMLLQSTCLVAN